MSVSCVVSLFWSLLCLGHDELLCHKEFYEDAFCLTPRVPLAITSLNATWTKTVRYIVTTREIPSQRTFSSWAIWLWRKLQLRCVVWAVWDQCQAWRPIQRWGCWYRLLSRQAHRYQPTSLYGARWVETVGKYSFVFAALSVLFFIMGFV